MRHLLFLVALFASACVAFVGDDPGSIGSACKFKGTDKPCGQCIAASCQAQVNACCVASGCKDRGMQAVDACAQGVSDQCISYSLSDPLQTCIEMSCGKECLGEVVSCTGQTYECSCNIQTNGGSTTTCDTTTVTNAICCASTDWPSRSSSCRCTYWGCQFLTDSCDCSTHSGGPGGSLKNACYPPQGGGYHCCLSTIGGSCSCTTSNCTSQETEVPDCSPMNGGCGNYAKRVASCSP